MKFIRAAFRPALSSIIIAGIILASSGPESWAQINRVIETAPLNETAVPPLNLPAETMGLNDASAALSLPPAALLNLKSLLDSSSTKARPTWAAQGPRLPSFHPWPPSPGNLPSSPSRFAAGSPSRRGLRVVAFQQLFEATLPRWKARSESPSTEVLGQQIRSRAIAVSAEAAWASASHSFDRTATPTAETLVWNAPSNPISFPPPWKKVGMGGTAKGRGLSGLRALLGGAVSRKTLLREAPKPGWGQKKNMVDGVIASCINALSTGAFEILFVVTNRPMLALPFMVLSVAFAGGGFLLLHRIKVGSLNRANERAILQIADQLIPILPTTWGSLSFLGKSPQVRLDALRNLEGLVVPGNAHLAAVMALLAQSETKPENVKAALKVLGQMGNEGAKALKFLATLAPTDYQGDIATAMKAAEESAQNNASDPNALANMLKNTPSEMEELPSRIALARDWLSARTPAGIAQRRAFEALTVAAAALETALRDGQADDIVVANNRFEALWQTAQTMTNGHDGSGLNALAGPRRPKRLSWRGFLNQPAPAGGYRFVWQIWAAWLGPIGHTAVAFGIAFFLPRFPFSMWACMWSFFGGIVFGALAFRYPNGGFAPMALAMSGLMALVGTAELVLQPWCLPWMTAGFSVLRVWALDSILRERSPLPLLLWLKLRAVRPDPRRLKGSVAYHKEQFRGLMGSYWQRLKKLREMVKYHVFSEEYVPMLSWLARGDPKFDVRQTAVLALAARADNSGAAEQALRDLAADRSVSQDVRSVAGLQFEALRAKRAAEEAPSIDLQKVSSAKPAEAQALLGLVRALLSKQPDPKTATLIMRLQRAALAEAAATLEAALKSGDRDSITLAALRLRGRLSSMGAPGRGSGGSGLNAWASPSLSRAAGFLNPLLAFPRAVARSARRPDVQAVAALAAIETAIYLAALAAGPRILTAGWNDFFFIGTIATGWLFFSGNTVSRRIRLLAAYFFFLCLSTLMTITSLHIGFGPMANVSLLFLASNALVPVVRRAAGALRPGVSWKIKYSVDRKTLDPIQQDWLDDIRGFLSDRVRALEEMRRDPARSGVLSPAVELLFISLDPRTLAPAVDLLELWGLWSGGEESFLKSQASKQGADSEFSKEAQRVLQGLAERRNAAAETRRLAKIVKNAAPSASAPDLPGPYRERISRVDATTLVGRLRKAALGQLLKDYETALAQGDRDAAAIARQRLDDLLNSPNSGT